MTSSALAKRPAWFAAGAPTQTFTGHDITHNEDGSAIVHGVQIFRVGTFIDMYGYESTWEDEHLQQMADNFVLLREKDVFPNVPVRANHWRDVKDVMGYFESLEVDGDYLVADLRITEPDALGKLVRGTFRSRSAEIGAFFSNDSAMYWPVMQGVAYVDIPAVQHLHSAGSPEFIYFERKEGGPVTTTTTSTSTTTPGPNDKAPAAPAAQPAAFTIAGAQTSDYAAVQAHITKLELRVAELEVDAKTARDASRVAFVAGLAEKNVITEAQKTSFSGLVVTMDDDQYAAFEKGFEAATPSALLANHGQPTGTPTNPAPGAAADAKAAKVASLQRQLKTFADAGKDPAWIAKTPQAIELASLTN